MAGIARKTKRYPSDLTDEEWSAIAPLLPAPGRTGRKRRTDSESGFKVIPRRWVVEGPSDG